MPYVDNNVPLVRNETLQKTVNQLNIQLNKLVKQQLQQQTQIKPKLPHFIDASPAIVSRDDVVCYRGIDHNRWQLLSPNTPINIIDINNTYNNYL
jgi:hypothetical protein